MLEDTDYIANVMKDLESCDNKENFLKQMKKYEDDFYKHYERQAQEKMVPELIRKDEKIPDKKPEGEYFLHTNYPNEKDYLTNFNRFNRFHGELREGDIPNQLQKTFQ